MRKLDNLVVGGDCEYYKGFIIVHVNDVGYGT